MNRRTYVGLVGGVVAGSLAGCLGVAGRREAAESIERSFDAAEVERLAVETVVGDIDVATHDRDEIVVAGEKRAAHEEDLEAVELEARVVDDRLELRVDAEDVDATVLGLQIGRKPGIDLEVRVPSAVRVEAVETTVGDVHVTRVRGPLAIDCTTGEVTGTEIEGDVSAELTTGDLHLEQVDGDIRAETTTGSVRVRDVDGSVRAKSTTGDITAGEIAGDLRVDSTTGDVEVEAIGGEVTVA